MEDNKTKEVVSAEQYRKDSLTGRLYDSTHFDVTDTIDIMLEEYAVMRVEQSTKHLQDELNNLKQENLTMENLLHDILDYDYKHTVKQRVSALTADLSSRIIGLLNTKS